MAEQRKLYPEYDDTIFLRSCKQEIVEPIQGKITGTIPKWLNGELIRNGPGTLTVGNETFQHLFDSLALLRKFSIKNGEVTYQCKFLESEAYKTCNVAKRIVLNGFGTKSVPDPCHTVFQKLSNKFVKDTGIFDNSSVSVYPFDDELYAFGEVPFIHKINKKTLETEERVNVNNRNFTVVHHTSHPHVAEDGTVYNLGMTVNKMQLKHNIVCFPSKTADSSNDHSMFDKANIVASIPARWPLYPSYMHSFGMTENYFIIIEQPWSLSVPQLMLNQLINNPIANCFKSFKNEMTQFSIINRRTGKVIKVYSEAFFYFHIINQYELPNYIVLDICAYDEAFLIEYFSMENMKNIQSNPHGARSLRSYPIRFVLPLLERTDIVNMKHDINLASIINTKAKGYFLPNGKVFVKPEKLCSISCEFPRINYEHYSALTEHYQLSNHDLKSFLISGKEYQYFYAVCQDIDSKCTGMLLKVDTRKKTTKTWQKKNCYASEPIFVPRPQSKEEDDGILLASLIWGGSDTNRVGLIILDAKTMTEIGRAEFNVLSPIPLCFHGLFVSEKTSKPQKDV